MTYMLTSPLPGIGAQPLTENSATQRHALGMIAEGQDPVYGSGHDHVADPPGAPDWNVAWEVVEVVFTPKAVAENAITHLKTDGDIEDAVAAGYATTMDLQVAFNCSVVSPTVYAHGTPITG